MLTVGADIGQAQDPTAIVVVDTRSGYPPAEPWEKAARETHHTVRWIERVPLGTNYPAVVERIAAVTEGAAQVGQVTLVVDQTGVGRPVVDMLRQRLTVPIRGVTITAGTNEVASAYEWKVPKRELVAGLEVTMQSRRLHVAEGVQLADDMRAELRAFSYDLSDRGRDTYEGKGRHDDMVIALALAIYAGERPGQGAAFLEYWRRDIAARGGSVLPFRRPRRRNPAELPR